MIDWLIILFFGARGGLGARKKGMLAPRKPRLEGNLLHTPQTPGRIRKRAVSARPNETPPQEVAATLERQQLYVLFSGRGSVFVRENHTCLRREGLVALRLPASRERTSRAACYLLINTPPGPGKIHRHRFPPERPKCRRKKYIAAALEQQQQRQ